MTDRGAGSRTEAHDVIIVGGGCAGALVAAQIVAHHAAGQIAIVEPGELALGVAYATDDEQHVLNVPAAKMTALEGAPNHFLEWLGARSIEGAPDSFLPRRVYGRYLQAVLADASAAAASAGGGVTHERHSAVAVTATADGGEMVQIDDGRSLSARHVVLALGAQPTQALDSVPTSHAQVFGSPWEPGALGPTTGDTTLLIGTGLTAVDAALSICARDPDRRVTAVSRTGALPFAHLPQPLRAPVDPPAWTDPVTVDTLLAAFTRRCDEVATSGGDWRDVVDATRPHVSRLWHALGEAGQTDFLRRCMRQWEIRRHRMAPHVAARLDGLREEGRFEVRAGSVQSARAAGSRIDVTLDTGDGVQRLTVDHIVSCIGPGLDLRASTSPLVSALLSTRRATADVHGIGFRTDEHGALLDQSGVGQPTLLTLGALRRGELWESTAVPEIRAQAQRLGAAIAAKLQEDPAAGSSAVLM